MENETSGKREIIMALAKVQGAIKNPKKDTDNPFFKSKYADLASVWDSVRGLLAANGLAFVQLPTTDGTRVSVTGILYHSAGESIESAISANAKDSMPQSIGSCITYLRRYQMSSMLGIAAEQDDDGNAATGPTEKPRSKAQERPGFSTGISVAQFEAEQAAKAKPEPKPQTDLGTFEDRILSYRIAKEGNSQGKPWTLYMVQTAENGELCTLDPALIDALKTPITTEERCIIESEPSKGGPKITAFAILATAGA